MSTSSVQNSSNAAIEAFLRDDRYEALSTSNDDEDTRVIAFISYFKQRNEERYVDRLCGNNQGKDILTLAVQHGNPPMLQYLADNVNKENVMSFIETSPILENFKNDKKSELDKLVESVKEFIMSFIASLTGVECHTKMSDNNLALTQRVDALGFASSNNEFQNNQSIR